MSARFSSLAFAGAALVGIAAIGAGAAATFTDSTTSSQTITAGTLDVSLTAPNTTCLDASVGCKTVELQSVGPVTSTFETAPVKVTLNNTGTIPAYYDTIRVSETGAVAGASLALLNQVNVCIEAKDPSGVVRVVANGPLTSFVGQDVSVGTTPLRIPTNGSTGYWYRMSLYAGQDSSYCGAAAVPTGGASPLTDSLTNVAMGGVVTPTLAIDFRDTVTD